MLYELISYECRAVASVRIRRVWIRVIVIPIRGAEADIRGQRSYKGRGGHQKAEILPGQRKT